MFANIFKLLRYVFENGPNVVFWIGLVVLGRDWFIQQGLFTQVLVICVPIIGIAISAKKIYRDVRAEVLYSGAKRAVGAKGRQSNDYTKSLLESIPSNSSLKSIYSYAADYAKTWASDGRIEDINFYVLANKDGVESSAQIFIHSSLRNEQLTTYLPKMRDSLDELGESAPHLRSNGDRKPIHSFPGWRDELKKSIESSASDIAKADEVSLQISPSSHDLTATLIFALDNRVWKKYFTLSQLKNRE